MPLWSHTELSRQQQHWDVPTGNCWENKCIPSSLPANSGEHRPPYLLPVLMELPRLCVVEPGHLSGVLYGCWISQVGTPNTSCYPSPFSVIISIWIFHEIIWVLLTTFPVHHLCLDLPWGVLSPTLHLTRSLSPSGSTQLKFDPIACQEQDVSSSA